MQQLNRRLREEQDAEYQRSLLADQEREKQRVAERAAQEEQQRAAQQAQDAERQEPCLSCPVERCLDCLHMRVPAVQSLGASVVATLKSACVLVVNSVPTAISLHTLKPLKQSVLYIAEAIVLSNLAAVAHAHTLAGCRQICNVIIKRHHFALSYVVPRSDIHAIQFDCIKSMVCQTRDL